MNLKKILSIPKSIYVNFKVLNVREALKLPVLISYDTRIQLKRGSLKIDNIQRFGIKIGFEGWKEFHQINAR